MYTKELFEKYFFVIILSKYLASVTIKYVCVQAGMHFSPVTREAEDSLRSSNLTISRTPSRGSMW